METKMYSNNQELWKSINNESHSFNKSNKIKDFTLSNIDKITHINGSDVNNVRNVDGSTIEYSFKGSRKLNYCSIILSDIIFNKD